MNRVGILILMVLSVLAYCGRTASAQWVSNDSAGGLVYGGYGEPNPHFADGLPDHQYAHMDSSSGSLLDMGFSRDTATHKWLPIEPKSRLTIYGARDPGVDSSAVSMYFYHTALDGSIDAISHEYIITPGITQITVPDTSYTYIEFLLTGAGTLKGSKGFWLDAIVLHQDFTKLGVGRYIAPRTASSVAYPNPSTAGSPMHIAVHSDRSAQAEVVVYDQLGRIASRTALGRISAGDVTVPFIAPAAGTYFARVLLDGVQAATVKISVSR